MIGTSYNMSMSGSYTSIVNTPSVVVMANVPSLHQLRKVSVETVTFSGRIMLLEWKWKLFNLLHAIESLPIILTISIPAMRAIPLCTKGGVSATGDTIPCDMGVYCQSGLPQRRKSLCSPYNGSIVLRYRLTWSLVNRCSRVQVPPKWSRSGMRRYPQINATSSSGIQSKRSGCDALSTADSTMPKADSISWVANPANASEPRSSWTNVLHSAVVRDLFDIL